MFLHFTIVAFKILNYKWDRFEFGSKLWTSVLEYKIILNKIQSIRCLLKITKEARFRRQFLTIKFINSFIRYLATSQTRRVRVIDATQLPKPKQMGRNSNLRPTNSKANVLTTELLLYKSTFCPWMRLNQQQFGQQQNSFIHWVNDEASCYNCLEDIDNYLRTISKTA